MRQRSQNSLNLDLLFAALADPIRRAILVRLAQGEATVMELAKPFRVTQPAISRHLKLLEGAGLIERRAEGTRRHCKLSRAGLDGATDWLEKLRGALTRNYERLDGVLKQIEAEKGKPKR